jgi:hypothetical protein
MAFDDIEAGYFPLGKRCGIRSTPGGGQAFPQVPHIQSYSERDPRKVIVRVVDALEAGQFVVEAAPEATRCSVLARAFAR